VHTLELFQLAIHIHKWLGHDLVLVLVHNVSDSLCLQGSHMYFTIIQNGDQTRGHATDVQQRGAPQLTHQGSIAVIYCSSDESTNVIRRG